jgi:SAM-dependent methyltransferase
VTRGAFSNNGNLIGPSLSKTDSPASDRHNDRVTSSSTFEELVANGKTEPTEGWDFSWFDGRATEQRPSWKFAESLRQRMTRADAVLDVQTGGGERLSEILSQIENRPRLIAATESWEPNVLIAEQNLRQFGASVIEVADESDFPFADDTFGLVTSRHPTFTLWKEIARVLQPGGTYFSQQVGSGTNSELADFMMGSQPGGYGERRGSPRATGRGRWRMAKMVERPSRRFTRVSGWYWPKRERPIRQPSRTTRRLTRRSASAGLMVNWGVVTPLRSDDVSRLERLAARGLNGTLPSLKG